MEPLYDVCFSGQLLDGQTLESVRQNIQKLFKANPGALDKLFSGKTQVLKRGCDKPTALKYKQAMEQAGAKPLIRAHTQSPAAPEPEQPPPDTAVAKSTAPPAPEQGLNLAPIGSDVLRPEERPAPEHTEVDLTGLDLAAVGSTLGESAATTAQAPDTSHLSVGEVGEDIPTLPDTRTPLNPDINNISLSPEGHDFSDCAAPAGEIPALDLSGIEIAPEGSDVLAEQYKKKDEAVAPNTGHISLAED